MSNRRRPVRARNKSARKSPNLPVNAIKWLFRLACIGLVLMIAFWTTTTWNKLSKQAVPLKVSTSHGFLAVEGQEPTLLLIKQGANSATIDTLAIVKISADRKSMIRLKLPNDISDGRTTAGQYMQSAYYKELQQMIERTLALPISGYIVEPKTTTTTKASSWIDVLLSSPKPSTWETTLGLPKWLDTLAPVQTSLTWKQLVQYAWVVRDMDDTLHPIQTLPSNALTMDQGKHITNESVLDPLITSWFVSQESQDQPVSVVIKNATNTSGLAALTARFVEHMGGEIVAAEPSDSGQSRTTMTAQQDSELSTQVGQFLGIPLTKASYTGRERSDMEIILGEDVIARLGM